MVSLLRERIPFSTCCVQRIRHLDKSITHSFSFEETFCISKVASWSSHRLRISTIVSGHTF